MTSQAEIVEFEAHNGDLAATNLIDAARLDTDKETLRSSFNALLAKLAVAIRDDDTLNDAIVRIYNLHTEVAALIASAQGWKPKVSVAVATTGNITLSGEQTINGVLTSTSRVLVRAQTAGAENGIYVSAAGAWTRATDADSADDLGYAAVYVDGGTTLLRSTWVLTAAAGDITLGSTVLTWARFGDGLDITVAAGAIGATELATNSVITAKILAKNVTNDKLADMPTMTLQGNNTGGTASPSALTVADVIAMLNLPTAALTEEDVQDIVGALIQDSTEFDFTYDDPGAALTLALIANGVANTKLAQVNTATFKGRATAGTGNVEDMTATQATALLNAATTSLKGTIELATSTEVATGTDATRAMCPSTAGKHQSAAKGWVRFEQNGTHSALDSYNVSSLTDSGLGWTTINWNTNFSNANFCTIASSGDDNFAYGLSASTGTSWVICSTSVNGVSGTSRVDSDDVYCVAFGDQ